MVGILAEFRSYPIAWCKKQSGCHGLRHGWIACQTVTADRLTVGLSPASARVSGSMQHRCSARSLFCSSNDPRTKRRLLGQEAVISDGKVISAAKGRVR